MQAQGSLSDTSLANLLEAMAAERATGTLALEQGANSCSLYFLFGHLFHAASADKQGEQVVVEALGWPGGAYRFDPRAKLPAEETIRSTPEQLIAEAGRRAPVREAEATVFAAPQAYATARAGGATETYSPWSTTPLQAPVPPQAVESPSTTTAPEPEPAPGLIEETAAVATATAPTGSSNLSAMPAGNPYAEPLTSLYPLPNGKAVYEGLKSAFVDFPKLLRTLRNDTHTGYTSLYGENFHGVLLFHDGRVLEALFSNGAIIQGEAAFQAVRRRMEAGEGLLDVVDLSGETVVSLAQLLTARPLYTGLLGRFVNFPALLDYLREERVDGTVVVDGESEMGVILLRRGGILGAYSASNRDLVESPDSVARLATERSSRIEVKGGVDSITGIDVDAALRKPI